MSQTVEAKVMRRGYSHKGNTIAVGRIVRLTRAQFERSKRINPPFFREATKDEIAREGRIIDLSTLAAAPAENVREAEEADAGGPPKPKK